MKYYIAINNQACGPFDHHELLTNGLTATSLVWAEGMPEWKQAQDVPELQELLFGNTTEEMRREARRDEEENRPTPPPLCREEPRETEGPRYAPGCEAPRYGAGYGQQYGQQSGRQQAGYGANGPQFDPRNPYGPGVPPCPKTWLAESIIVTILCCLPLGVVGIIKASEVEGLWRSGQYMRAQDASRSAGFWTKLGFFCALGIGLLYCCGLGFGLLGALI